MRPEHIELLQLPSSPTVHPDGSWAVVAVSRPSLDADCYVGQLWRLDLAGDAAPRRLTRGVHDSGPQFSPDGRLLAFTRGDADGKPQVHVVRTDGGEPFVITAAKLGVGAFRWSPDSARIAFPARVAEDGRYGSTEGVAAGAWLGQAVGGAPFAADDPAEILFLLLLRAVIDQRQGTDAGVGREGHRERNLRLRCQHKSGER